MSHFIPVAPNRPGKGSARSTAKRRRDPLPALQVTPGRSENPSPISHTQGPPSPPNDCDDYGNDTEEEEDKESDQALDSLFQQPRVPSRRTLYLLPRLTSSQ